MNVIIPIGGIGQRFIDEGFSKPKPLISVLGEPMIKKVINSLSLTKFDTLHIVYNQSLEAYNFSDLLKHHFSFLDIRFYPIDRMTKGAAETVKICLDNLSEEELNAPFLLVDGDTIYDGESLSEFEGDSNLIFYSVNTDPNPIYSYIKVDEEGKVLEIAEKVKISDYANTGAYGFENGLKLKSYIEELLSIETTKELYISQVYSLMLERGEEILACEIKDFDCVGTPLQLKVYSNKSKYDSKLLRLCFDLDNTLVSYPKVPGDYSSVTPIKKNIDLVRELYELGHTIIIHTARRMRTHSGNVGRVTKDIGMVTMETLDRFNIPYHELYFGKPFADFYIDDLGVDAGGDLRKALGIYNNQTPSRDFNSVSYSDSKVIKHTNNPGEVYFYKNIPDHLSDLFPTTYVAEENKIEMDYVLGVSYSKLFIDQALTFKDLDTLCDSLERMHQTPLTGSALNVYDSYIEKVQERFEKNPDSYSWFSDADSLYYRVVKALQSLKPIQPSLGVIHGDPVFTNIIKTHQGIKMIDMRGKVGDELTIFGHTLYDLAKVYQSLLGYDYILEGESADFIYQFRLINHFEERYQSNLNEIKILTASLFFSLLPLHTYEWNKFHEYLHIVGRLLNDSSN